MKLNYSKMIPPARGTQDGAGFLAEFKRLAIAKTLHLCPLFADLPAADLDAISTITVLKFLAKGEYLFFKDTTADGFYVLQRGAVKISRVNAHGDEQVLHVFRPTESFAEEALVTESGHVADARAIEASQVLLVQRAGFLGLLKRRPDLALWVLRSMSEHVNQLVGLLDDLALKDVKTRLADWLLQHSTDPQGRTPQNIPLPTTKRMLASELGTTSETFSRTLKIFRNQKLIAVGAKTLTLFSAFRLREMLLQNLGVFPSPPAQPPARRSNPEWRPNPSATPDWSRQNPYGRMNDFYPNHKLAQ